VTGSAVLKAKSNSTLKKLKKSGDLFFIEKEMRITKESAGI